jgi:pimeloyl-ACP methyl ester carboxylesterase
MLAWLCIAGCGSSGGAAEVAPQIAWAACGNQGAECATLYVPLNPYNDNGTRISLALKRFPSSGAKQGSILMNPGGPGASAVEYLDYFAETSFGHRLRENFDLVTFDPRGVGQSTAVRCVDNPLPYVAINKSPENALEYEILLGRAEEYAAKCAENSGALLGHVNTMDAVRDMELIRWMLGEGKLNYIGLSYGTKIGALYADTYPLNVRAMVLDGVVPPSLTSLELTLEQTAGFEKSLQAFLTSCAENSSCAFGGENPKNAFKALLADIKQQPLPAGNGRMLTFGEAYYGISMAMYSRSYWPELENALAAAAAGDGSQLLTLNDDYFWRADDGTFPNMIDAYFAVYCTDASPMSIAEVRAHAEAAALAYPFFGAPMMYDNLYCSYWPAAPGLQPKIVRASGAPQIMVVGTTGDPATPYAWSQRLAGELDSSFLVTFQGERHVAAGQCSCVDDRYVQYLLHPETGFSDIYCTQDAGSGKKAYRSSELPKSIRRW